MKIIKGDNVIMLQGKDKGKKAQILKVMPEDNLVLVEGLNLVKKNVRARKQGQTSQIISKERPVSVSSIALVCKSCGKQTRVGFKFMGEKENNKVRICKKCGAEIR